MKNKLENLTNEDVLSKEKYFKLYLEDAEEYCCCDCEETHYEGDGYNEPRYKTCSYDGENEQCPYIISRLEDMYEEYLEREIND